MDVCGPLLGLHSEFMKFILTRPRLSSLCYEGFEFRVRECGKAGRVSLTEILIAAHVPQPSVHTYRVLTYGR